MANQIIKLLIAIIEWIFHIKADILPLNLQQWLLILMHRSINNHGTYTNSGASNHITTDLESHCLQTPYRGIENVTVGNRSALPIANTVSSTIIIPSSHFKLNDIFHCPNAFTNRLSIQKFSINNNCYFVLISIHFFVKDNSTGQTLLQG